MKIKIWTAIIDDQDGSSHTETFKTKDEMVEKLGLTDVDQGDWGNAFDEHDGPVEFTCDVFDTEGYEVVE